jgi:hypothetical protein
MILVIAKSHLKAEYSTIELATLAKKISLNKKSKYNNTNTKLTK